MTKYLLDTSALAKAFREEEGSIDVMVIFADLESQFLITSLTTVEFQSVFAQKVRAGQISIDDYQLVRRKFGGQVRTKSLIVKNLLRRHQRRAEQLIATHGPQRRLRTLDALQLAMAVELNADGQIDYFVVADRQLAEIARLEGLHVIEPSGTLPS